MSKGNGERAEPTIAERFETIFGGIDGDLTDFVLGNNPRAAAAEDGAWMLVRDALAVADLLASQHKLGTYRGDTGNNAAVLIVRLLQAAQDAREMALQEDRRHD